MNIAFLIFSFNIGGIERLLIDMSNNMSANGHNIFLIVINDDFNKDLLGLLSPKVHIIFLHRQMGEKKLFPYMLKLAKIVKRNKIQVLHCQGINCVIFSFIVKVFSHKTAILNTVHDNGNYTRTYSKKKIFLAHLLLDMTIAISDSVRNEILSQGIDSDKVVTIHNAIDIDKFQYVPRKEKKFDNNTPIEIVNVARFMPEKKGQDLLVNAARKLVKKYPLLHITFAGAVARNQEESYHKILEYIKEADLEKNISFAGNVDNIPELLATADLFVLPSRYEGFGIALVEALATGLVVVASNLEGPAEIMKCHPEYGLLFEPGNADDLAVKINDVITNFPSYNPELISQKVRKDYNMDNMCLQHISLYRALL